jgi:hypothetical protein
MLPAFFYRSILPALIFCTCFSSGNAAAQTFVGFHGGLTVGRLDKPFVDGYVEPGLQTPYRAQDYFHPGLTAGVGLEYPLHPRLVLAFGFHAIQKNNRRQFEPYLFYPLAEDTIRSIVTKSTFVEFPVGLRATLLSNEKYRCRVGLGLGLARWSHRKLRENYTDGSFYSRSNAVYGTPSTRSFEASLQTSLGWEWKKEGGFWRLEGLYAHGLTNLATERALEGVFKRFQTRTMALRLSWWFDVRRFWENIHAVPAEE